MPGSELFGDCLAIWLHQVSQPILVQKPDGTRAGYLPLCCHEMIPKNAGCVDIASPTSLRLDGLLSHRCVSASARCLSVGVSIQCRKRRWMTQNMDERKFEWVEVVGCSLVVLVHCSTERLMDPAIRP